MKNIIIISLILIIAAGALFVWGIMKASFKALTGPRAALLEMIFGKVVETYDNVLLVVQEIPGISNNIIYDFSLYEEKRVVGMIYCRPECTEEKEPGILPNMTLRRYADGTVLVDI